jgi:hypothetical protein
MATDSNCALWQAVPAQQCLSLVAVASTQTYLLLLQTLLVAHTVFVVAVLDATAARLGALGVGAPGGDNAVDGAVVGVAGRGLRGRGASHAAVERGDEDLAAASGRATAARLGARGPRAPWLDGAVDRARVRVAVDGGVRGATDSAASGLRSHDGAGLELGTATAGSGAHAKV